MGEHFYVATKRDEIIVAAQQCFAEDGYGSVTMSAVAYAVGLKKQSLSHYYSSKLQLAHDAFAKFVIYCQQTFFDPIMDLPYSYQEVIMRLVNFIDRDVRSYLPFSLAPLYQDSQHAKLQGLYMHYCASWRQCWRNVFCEAKESAWLADLVLLELAGAIQMRHSTGDSRYVDVFQVRVQMLLRRYGGEYYQNL